VAMSKFNLSWGLVLAASLASCGQPPADQAPATTPGDDPAPTTAPVPPTTPATTEPVVELVALQPVDRLIRLSMALRGLRPSMEDMERVRADPAEVDVILEEYLDGDDFLRKMRDLHAEVFLLDNDIEKQLPAVGWLDGYDFSDMHHSQVMEPLKLVEHIVANDRPYTEIVTADYMFANDVVAKIYGLPYDFDSEEEWQMSWWTDGRPAAGLLSSGKLFRRFTSNGNNFQRARANMVASKFLCSDFNNRDVLVLGGVDVSDEFAVAEAVMNVPECVSCHQALDPLAGYFWGYMDILNSAAISVSHIENCKPFDYSKGAVPEHGHNQTPEFMCYPVRQYNAFNENDWAKWDLREPNYYGTPASGLAELGELIAADPRFHSCTARHFFGFFDQVDPEKVPIDIVADLQSEFVASGFSAKELARQAVKRPEFGAFATSAEQPDSGPVVSVKAVRSKEYGTAIEDLTGYRWVGVGDANNCATADARSTQCWGPVDLNNSDVFGFRSMAGGIDSFLVTTPTRSVTAVKLIASQMYAADASAFVVADDLARPAVERRLLHLVEADTTDEQVVREQLAWLHARILGEFLEPDDAELDLSYELWLAAQDLHGTATEAWVVTLTALFQDPRFLFY